MCDQRPSRQAGTECTGASFTSETRVDLTVNEILSGKKNVNHKPVNMIIVTVVKLRPGHKCTFPDKLRNFAQSVCNLFLLYHLLFWNYFEGHIKAHKAKFFNTHKTYKFNLIN